MSFGQQDTTIELFGVRIRAETLDQAAETILQRIEQRVPVLHSVLNAGKVSKLASDPDFLSLMNSFDMIHADGASIVLAGRLLGRPVPERVAGIDLMQRLVASAAVRGLRPYFLGATPDVVEACVRELKRRHPQLEPAGFHHGYWKEGEPSEEVPIVERIQRSGADMLFVAMPTPRKERFLIRNRAALGVPFAMGVGGSFDVIAGLVKRAPESWQRLGMEWAYRLIQEPRRMWKRYLVTNTHFLWILAKERVRQRPGR
jgi:N-acetylglucosaminyldiphosphoundecaprenol N-acetyl-beta-D-mannosaminyltransferase